MSHQALSETTPPIFPDSTLLDSAPLYSSFEHFQPGLKFLSNDPSSKDRPLVLDSQQKKKQQQQRQQQQQQQRELSNDTSPQDDDVSDLPISSSKDSDFVDLLYVVDSAGETTIMDVTGPTRLVPPPTPQTASTTSSSQDGFPAEHDGSTQTKPLPPFNAAANPPFTLVSTRSDSARAPKSAALKGGGEEEEEEEEEDADASAREAKLMGWWPRAEADELKVERL